MSRADPIDLETFIKDEGQEEDLYGTPMKCEHEESDRDETVPLKYMKTPTGKRGTARKARSPNATPRHRRHPQDAELEDRVLMRLIDNGMGWPYPQSHDIR